MSKNFEIFLETAISGVQNFAPVKPVVSFTTESKLQIIVADSANNFTGKSVAATLFLIVTLQKIVGEVVKIRKA